MQLRRFRHVVLQRCRSKDTATFKTIYHEERRRLKMPKSVMAFLPLKKIRPSMRKARMNRFPKAPKTISGFAKILASNKWRLLSKTLDKKDSIFAASGGKHADRTQFVILTSRRMVKYMGRVKSVFSDGTFCTPSHMKCSQIWNLVTVRRNHTICLARVLMESRKTKCYIRVLKAVKRLQPRFKPVSIMADFEKGQQKGWAKLFPNAKRRGCHFHYNKNVTKKARKDKLTKLIKNNKDASELLGCICALPLLPENSIIDGYLYIVRRTQKKGLYGRLQRLLVYVWNTWILGEGGIMSVYRCPDRTSNVCESDNASLNGLLWVKHPSIWTLLGAFLESEDNTFQDLKTLDRGRNPTAARRTSALENDEMLRGLWQDLDDGTMTVGKFLRQASKSVEGVVHRKLLKIK